MHCNVLCMCVCCCRRYGRAAEFDEAVPAADGTWREMIIVTHIEIYLSVNVIIDFKLYECHIVTIDIVDNV